MAPDDRAKRTSRWQRLPVEKLNSYLQTVVLVGGAIGGVVLYFRFDSDSKRLAVEQQVQQIALASIELQAKQARRVAYRLEMNVICMEDEGGCETSLQRPLAATPDDPAVDDSYDPSPLGQLGPPVSPGTQAGKQAAKPTRQRDDHATPAAPPPSSLIDASTTPAVATAPKPDKYAIAFGLRIENTTSVPITVASNAVTVYVGSQREEVLKGDVARINPPFVADGAIKWTRLQTVKFADGEGGNTGTLVNGDHRFYVYGFVARAHPGDWLGVAAKLQMKAPAFGTIPKGPDSEQIVHDYCRVAGKESYWQCSSEYKGLLAPLPADENGATQSSQSQ